MVHVGSTMNWEIVYFIKSIGPVKYFEDREVDVISNYSDINHWNMAGTLAVL